MAVISLSKRHNHNHNIHHHHHHRPPYKGTFTPHSKDLSGRNPFEKDHAVFNYDYDSEGEWEEGDGEGEDIGESDDEDEGGEGNELEYDEFLLRDNDFGSDADSDGEAIAAATIQRREGIETLGPCFIFPTDQSLTPQSKPSASMSCAIRLDREGLQEKCSDKSKDVIRLKQYTAVVYALPHQLPYLGGDLNGGDASAALPMGGKDQKPLQGDKKPKPVEFSDELLLTLARYVHGSKESMPKLQVSACHDYASYF